MSDSVNHRPTPKPRPCNSCGAKPGDLHELGCGIEHCALCGGQSISCACVYRVCGIDTTNMETTHPDIYNNGATVEMWERFDAELARWGGRMPWTGEYPGCAEAREFDLWRYGPPWTPCTKDHPRATESLNTLVETCVWSKEKRRWVKP